MAIRLSASFLLVGLLSSCTSVEPSASPRFSGATIGAVRLGMSYDDVVRLIGAPLEYRKATRAASWDVFVCAAPGYTNFRSQYRFGAKGHVCAIIFRNSKVSEVLLSNSSTGTDCSCRNGECPPTWSQGCFPR